MGDASRPGALVALLFPGRRCCSVTGCGGRAARESELTARCLIFKHSGKRKGAPGAADSTSGLVSSSPVKRETSDTRQRSGAGGVLQPVQEELESINFNKWPMASRGSCWGSCFASSKALSPISRAWSKERGHGSRQELGSSRGRLKCRRRSLAERRWSRARPPAPAAEGDLHKLLCRREESCQERDHV